MITKRLLVLTLAVIGILSLIFVLPHQLGYQPVGVALALPEYLGAWWGHEGTISEKERVTLGPDTEFARKIYQSGTGDAIHTSIVLAGQDMMTGIHRPERCLYAQGWTTGSSSLEEITVPAFGQVQVTRLQITRADTTVPEHPRKIDSVAYYWFVGCNELTATHEKRIWIDMRDRILHGYNQRWAMVMLTAEITAKTQRFGRTEQQTDQMVAGFVQQLAPKILLPTFRRTASLEMPRHRLESHFLSPLARVATR